MPSWIKEYIEFLFFMLRMLIVSAILGVIIIVPAYLIKVFISDAASLIFIPCFILFVILPVVFWLDEE